MKIALPDMIIYISAQVANGGEKGRRVCYAIAIETSSTAQITAEVKYALNSNTAEQRPSRGIQQPLECHKCYVRYTR